MRIRSSATCQFVGVRRGGGGMSTSSHRGFAIRAPPRRAGTGNGTLRRHRASPRPNHPLYLVKGGDRMIRLAAASLSDWRVTWVYGPGEVGSKDNKEGVKLGAAKLEVGAHHPEVSCFRF